MSNNDYLYFFDGQWFESNAYGQLRPTTKRPDLETPDDTTLPCGTLDCCNTDDLLDN